MGISTERSGTMKHLVVSVIGTPEEIAAALRQTASFIEEGNDELVSNFYLGQAIAQPFDVEYCSTESRNASIGHVAGCILSNALKDTGMSSTPFLDKLS